MGAENKKTLKRLLEYLAPHRIRVCLSFLLSAVNVGLTMYVPVLAGKAIDKIIGPGAVDFDGLFAALAKVAITAALAAACAYLCGIINNGITFRIVRDMRNRAFEHIHSLPLKYLDAHPAGETVSRIIGDADQVADGLLMGFTQLFSGILTIAVTLGFMISIRASIAALVVVLTPLSIFVARFIAKHTYSYFKMQSRDRAEQTAFIDEMIGGQKTVKAFGMEEESLKNFDRVNDKLSSTSLKAVFYSSITNPATRFVNNMVYAAVALAGALIAINTAGGEGALSIGALSALLAYANQYTKPFNEISGVVTELQNALACASRLFELIEETPEDDEMAAAGGKPCEGRVDIEKMYFAYTSEKPLIENMNLSAMPGQHIAIVGPTGCGKTTLINLLMRFYDADKGSIRIDGTDIRTIKRKSLRSNWGMVLQDTWLKSGTVRENLLIGKPEATDDEIMEACRAAHAHSFIRRLPNGYDTVLGEDGGGLSQGQKQLLCIARVMLRRPPMLILDEATSSIDTRTEMKIQSAFLKLMEGRTSFIVAHRLSTVRDADAILVMRDGHIVEQGRHEELLEKGGFYSRLYNSQWEN